MRETRYALLVKFPPRRTDLSFALSFISLALCCTCTVLIAYPSLARVRKYTLEYMFDDSATLLLAEMIRVCLLILSYFVFVTF